MLFTDWRFKLREIMEAIGGLHFDLEYHFGMMQDGCPVCSHSTRNAVGWSLQRNVRNLGESLRHFITSTSFCAIPTQSDQLGLSAKKRNGDSLWNVLGIIHIELLQRGRTIKGDEEVYHFNPSLVRFQPKHNVRHRRPCHIQEYCRWRALFHSRLRSYPGKS